MASTTTPTTALGDELKNLRVSTGISLRTLGKRSGIHHTSLGRYESGRVQPSAEHLNMLLDALNVDESNRERLLALTRRGRGPGELLAGVPSTGRQLAQLIGYERTATRITDVSIMVVPGILQTRQYARAVIGSPDTDRRVQLRVERTEILTRAVHPVTFRAIVHVEALTRPVAPPGVMREQMRHLLNMADLPNVTIHVVPTTLTGWLPSLAGPFMVIEFADAPPLIHMEHYRAGAFLWEEKDVRSFMTAADQMAQKAMTPTQSTEIIAHLAEMETTA